MIDRLVVSIGVGLAMAGGYACWSGWTSTDYGTVFAGLLGIGVGMALISRGFEPSE
jgi:hypothetical protein